MPNLVVDGATLQCSMGTATSRLAVPVAGVARDQSLAVATVKNALPLVNVAPFAMCRSLSNPQVALATAASLGALTPQPCVPAPVGAWSPGSAVVTVDGVPALTDACRCACAWAGVITVAHAGTEGLFDSA